MAKDQKSEKGRGEEQTNSICLQIPLWKVLQLRLVVELLTQLISPTGQTDLNWEVGQLLRARDILDTTFDAEINSAELLMQFLRKGRI